VAESKFYSLLTIMFMGMPPNHHLRMERALDHFKRTRNSEQWRAFLQRLKSERDMNVVVCFMFSFSVSPSLNGIQAGLVSTYDLRPCISMFVY
jgi:hypothetical protein